MILRGWKRSGQALSGLLVGLGALMALQGADQAGSALAGCHPRDGLPNWFAKLKTGGPLRIAYLGGSITAQPGWRPKTLRWFQGQFPKADIKEINAAIGGTGSDLGVFRLRCDVLEHRPDLLFVEFAVNDGGAPPHRIQQCMEGIVRQTWRAFPRTDICFIYTLAGNMLETYQAGRLPRSVTAMEEVAAHYGIPSINFGLEVARLEKAGRLIFKGAQPRTEAERAALKNRILFSPDGVHPYPESGHELYLQAVVRAMRRLPSVGQAGDHVLGEPLVADHYEAARMVPLSRNLLSGEWARMDPATQSLARRFQNRLPALWKATRPGAALSFRFRGRTAAVYDLLGPDCGQVIVTVDGGPPKVAPRFDAYCTYHRLATLKLATDLPEGLHSVRVEIHPEQPDKAAILARRHQRIEDPKRFDDTAWYAGALLLVGELVE